MSSTYILLSGWDGTFFIHFRFRSSLWNLFVGVKTTAFLHSPPTRTKTTHTHIAWFKGKLHISVLYIYLNFAISIFTLRIAKNVSACYIPYTLGRKKKSILCGWQMTWNTSRKVNWNPNRIIFDLQPCNSVMNKMEGLFIYVKMPKWNSCKKEENCWNWMCNPDEKRTQNMTMAYSKGFKRKITVRRRNQRKMRGIVTASNYL